MTYSCEPIQALQSRVQYLCNKHATGLKHNDWNGCWRVWVELVQKMHLVWPSERAMLTFSLSQDHRMGIGPATIVQGSIEILYCDNEGQNTGSDTFVFEWYTSLVLGLDVQHYGHLHKWACTIEQHTSEEWLRHLLKQPVLCYLAKEPVRWKRGTATIAANLQGAEDL